MDKALKAIETDERATRASRLDAHHASEQVEHQQQGQHGENGASSDPAQRDLVELTPVASGGLLNDVGFGVRDRPASLDLLQFLEEILLFHRLRRRID